MKAIVLSGGAGSRLGTFTANTPKGLVIVAGKPLLEHVIDWLKENDVKDIIIGVAYLHEKIQAHFEDGNSYGVKIQYSQHTVEGGTAQGFKLAIKRYIKPRKDKVFYAMNGDQITDLRLNNLSKILKDGVATITAINPVLPFSVLNIDGEYCRNFREKPRLKLFCSAGIYAFKPSISRFLPDTGDIERATFPVLAKDGLLHVYKHEGHFLTVNTPSDLDLVEAMTR